jgi:HK97 family phage portal protein
MNDFHGLIETKEPDAAPTHLGDTTNLPEGWQAFQDSLWETLTFQRNVNYLPRGNSVGLALAYQCADVKARDIAKCEMSLWRRVNKGRWDEVEPGRHWFAKMLRRRPNNYLTWTEFWRMVITHLELAQNAYILINETRGGDVQELIPIPSAMCRARTTTTGAIFYEINASTEFDRARLGDYQLIVPARRIIHLRGKMYDGLNGMSNLKLGDPLFNLMGAIARYQTKLFGSDAAQPIVFESDSAVFGVGDQADAAFRRLKQQLTERVKRMADSGDPILLEAGYKAKIIAQNARDAMTAEAYNATVMRMCGLMQVPPHKIFHYDSVKYDNQSAAQNQYANDCLIPIADNIEEKLRFALLRDDEVDDLAPEFDRMPMLAGDPKTLGDLLDQALKNGAIEINEYRERIPLDLNPIEGGDVRYVPVNMAIVGRDGKVIQQAATGQNQGQDPAAPKPAPKDALRLVVDR